jgi:hypothetical protein
MGGVFPCIHTFEYYCMDPEEVDKRLAYSWGYNNPHSKEYLRGISSCREIEWSKLGQSDKLQNKPYNFQSKLP